MSVGRRRAEELVEQVLQRLRPFIPEGVTVTIKTVGSLMTVKVQRERALGTSAGTSELTVGRAIAPWLPKSVAARIAAQDAAERILGPVYGGQDCAVKVRIDAGLVYVSFRAPAHNGERHELEPLPISLCV